MFGYSLVQQMGLVDFGKMSGSTRGCFDAIMGTMVMLGCGCGILFPVPCDSVIPLRKPAGDCGRESSEVTARNCLRNDLLPFDLKHIQLNLN